MHEGEGFALEPDDRQAGLQFKLFTEKESPAELMREVLKRLTGPAKA